MRAIFIFLLTAASALADGDWREKITASKPGGFPAPRPLTLHYRLGWSGIPAGEASIQYRRPKPDLLEIDASGGTSGVARALWKMDAKHTATAHASTLRPIAAKQTEIYSDYSVTTNLKFTPTSVTHLRERPTDDNAQKPKTFRFPNVLDLHAALLFVRSQPLKPGTSVTFVVYPITSPYLATVTVLGREKISVKAGNFDAIKTDLKLWEINPKSLQLGAHQRFKRATAWLSDDRDRLPLKIESEIFVGSVWVELDRVNFEK